MGHSKYKKLKQVRDSLHLQTVADNHFEGLTIRRVRAIFSLP
jgi:hypothetical protein